MRGTAALPLEPGVVTAVDEGEVTDVGQQRDVVRFLRDVVAAEALGEQTRPLGGAPGSRGDGPVASRQHGQQQRRRGNTCLFCGRQQALDVTEHAGRDRHAVSPHDVVGRRRDQGHSEGVLETRT